MSLGTGTQKVSRGGQLRKIQQGGYQATLKWEPPLPAAANWHCHTETILSGKNTYPSEILTGAPTHDSREGGEGERIRKDSPTQSKR